MFKFSLLFFIIEARKDFFRYLPFRFFPIDNKKIVFSNYHGLGYGCNPKYIAEKLLTRKDLKLIWLVDKKNQSLNLPPKIKVVEYSSINAFKELLTAKIWVDNHHKMGFIYKGLIKRKEQFFIQTWHGSLGIKKIEGDVKVLNTPKSWTKLALANAKMQDFLLSNSNFEDEVFKSAFWNYGKILKLGHARNDIFFRDNQELKKRIFKYLNIDENKKILLYAPTYKQGNSTSSYCLDFALLKSTLDKKFDSEWIILTRMHKFLKKGLDNKNLDYVIDVTHYDDMQELLVCADAFLTDYSSCMFDFMLSKKPSFIFAADLKQYDSERGFYYSVYETPFPVAQDNDQLALNILNFDNQSYQKNVEKFLNEKGCIDDGNASQRTVEFIENLLTK